MLRQIFIVVALTAVCSNAYSASLTETNLIKKLEQVAAQSSANTPRAINEDILDQGYTVDGHTLVNHLSVRAEHAAQMRAHPDTVRAQLGASVCANKGFVELLDQGAELRYQFSEYRSNRPVVSETFTSKNCIR